MKTYMDKEVLINFMISKPADSDDEDKHTNWWGLRKFLRTRAELLLNVNLDKESQDPTSAFTTILTSFGYSGTRITCDTNKFRFKNKTDFQKEFSNADNLFFISEAKEGELYKWKSRNGFLVSDKKELLEAWRKLNLTYGLPRSLSVRDFDVVNGLKSWNDLTPYQHPVTDVVISDRFFLKDKGIAEANFIPMLKSLVSNKVAHYNLTFFTSKMEVFEKDVQKMKLYLEGHLKNAQINCSLNLVYDTIELFKEHDRNIITNYYNISAGDSFTLFDKRHEMKTNGTTLDIKPLVDPDYFANACAVLKNLKRSFDHPKIEKTEGANNRLLSLVE